MDIGPLDVKEEIKSEEGEQTEYVNMKQETFPPSEEAEPKEVKEETISEAEQTEFVDMKEDIIPPSEEVEPKVLC
ncbi:hypothetical protein L9F63_004029 [Diploptera punctata]|uniref:Uncharacterized protein n=1 Tax=Diploptera punctata TaxID=6984 RepID=A0AAD7ZI41_DIPPU|nr:hypothetical protein L9F63_004029 [Diploptera punctata]